MEGMFTAKTSCRVKVGKLGETSDVGNYIVPNLNEMIAPYFLHEPKLCLKESAHNDGSIIEAERDISLLVEKQRNTLLQSVSPSQLSYCFSSTAFH